MAANGFRRTLKLSAGSGKSLLNRSAVDSSSSKAANLKAFASLKSVSAPPRSSLRRVHAELGGALSLMPLHSITASALFTSLLSVTNQQWGCLSEGFATPL